MKVLKDAPTLYCDVDNTLVDITYLTDEDADADEGLILDYYGKVKLTPRFEFIEAVKQAKAAGYTIVIWSGSGTDWASKVVKALHLDKYVDVVVSKPHLIFDDIRTEDLFRDVIHARPSLVENPYKFIKKGKKNVNDQVH